MPRNNRDNAYLWDMLDACINVVDFIRGRTFANYESDKILQSAVERQVEVLGEAAGKVSPTFQDSHPEIPWRQIIGQRNVLAHEYKDIASKLIWSVATEHVPELKKNLEPLVPDIKE